MTAKIAKEASASDMGRSLPQSTQTALCPEVPSAVRRGLDQPPGPASGRPAHAESAGRRQDVAEEHRFRLEQCR